MIPVSLSFLFSLILVLGLGSPMASAELRNGRSAFLALQARAAAEGQLAEWVGTRWVDSTPAGPIGIRIAFDSVVDGADVAIAREIERVEGDLWLLSVEGRILDANGGIRAAARRGKLARVELDPADSTLRAIPVSRPSVRAFQ